MAQQTGVSPASVQRIWSVRDSSRTWVKAFTLSNDRRFEDKLIDDVVGLYLNPSERP